jgi:hypothetical protein
MWGKGIKVYRSEKMHKHGKLNRYNRICAINREDTGTRGEKNEVNFIFLARLFVSLQRKLTNDLR